MYTQAFPVEGPLGKFLLLSMTPTEPCTMFRWPHPWPTRLFDVREWRNNGWRPEGSPTYLSLFGYDDKAQKWMLAYAGVWERQNVSTFAHKMCGYCMGVLCPARAAQICAR